MKTTFILAMTAAAIVWLMTPAPQQSVKYVPLDRCISGLYRIVLKMETQVTPENVHAMCSNRR